MNIRTVLNLTLTLGLVGALALPTAGQSQPCESYFLCLFDYPVYEESGYHEDVQGLTHDDYYWFITQSDVDDSDPAERSLWKIPVTHDLDEVEPDDPEVQRISLDDIPELGGQGYDHFGDLTYYKNEDYDGQGYLVIPIEDHDWDLNSVIAVFKSSNLDYVGHDEVIWATGQKNLGWCAIDPEGYVYTSSWRVSSCYKFWLRWDLLPDSVQLEPVGEVPFLDEYGVPLTLTHMQGGVFTESGNLLYISSGMYETDDSPTPTDGINVFDTHTHRRVAHSTNGYGHFNYEWDPNCHLGDYQCEEPEGLTIWDLDDDPRVPEGISGQLHVLMLDNDDDIFGDDDDVSIKHYTQTIYVDSAYTGGHESGRPSEPFDTVGEANYHYPAWDGCRINIKAGSYPETLTFSARMEVVADGGSVIIGAMGGSP